MPNYSTIDEKVIEWNISVRHIQYLCRTGKIPGAVKRAGAWSIPDDTQNPAKNTKLNDKAFKFVGTKNKIFGCAIELSVQKGFANVSFKDIADKAGVQQSTVYSHFRTKQNILDSIYDYYCHYYLKDRLSLDEMEKIIHKEGLPAIMESIRYEFKDEYRQRMSDITKIIFQRIGVDERAKQIARTLVVDEGINYVEAVFNMGIEKGRFAPFDTHMMAVLINSARLFALYMRILDLPPEDMMKFMGDEQRLYDYAAGFVKDLNPLTLSAKAWEDKPASHKPIWRKGVSYASK